MVKSCIANIFVKFAIVLFWRRALTLSSRNHTLLQTNHYSIFLVLHDSATHFKNSQWFLYKYLSIWGWDCSLEGFIQCIYGISATWKLCFTWRRYARILLATKKNCQVCSWVGVRSIKRYKCSLFCMYACICIGATSHLTQHVSRYWPPLVGYWPSLLGYWPSFTRLLTILY